MDPGAVFRARIHAVFFPSCSCRESLHGRRARTLLPGRATDVGARAGASAPHGGAALHAGRVQRVRGLCHGRPAGLRATHASPPPQPRGPAVELRRSGVPPTRQVGRGDRPAGLRGPLARRARGGPTRDLNGNVGVKNRASSTVYGLTCARNVTTRPQ